MAEMKRPWWFGSYAFLAVCFVISAVGVVFFVGIDFYPVIMSAVFEGLFFLVLVFVLVKRHVLILPSEVTGERALIFSRGKESIRSALEESSRRTAEAKGLLRGSRAVLKHKDFQSAARAIFEICKELTGATAGYVAMKSSAGDENEVLFLDSGGRACAVDPDLPMPIRGLRGEAYGSGKAIYENDFGNSIWSKHIPSNHAKLDNVMFAPLILEGTVVGVIGLANKPGGFNENDARLVAGFGEIASIALENSRTVESLEKSESRFRRIFESNMMGIAFCRERGEVTEANDAFLDMVGYTREELLAGKVNWAAMTPPEQLQLSRDGIEEARAGGYFAPFEKEYIRKDGSRVSVLMGGASLVGEEHAGVAYAIDMTELKRAKEEVSFEKKKLDLLAEMIDWGVTARDADYTLTYQNDYITRIFGDRTGEKCYRVFQGRDEVCEGCPVELAFKDGQSHTSIREVVLPSGETNYWENTATPVRDAEGKIVSCLEINKDITERKRSEKVLAESEAWLRAAIGSLPFDFWMRDREGRGIMQNASSLERWGDITGRLPNEQGVSRKTLSVWESNNARAFAGETISEEVEYELSGQKRTFHSILKPVEVDGEITGILGINIDITERKEAERTLRESEERLRLLFETIPHAVYECDVDGVITVANSAYSRITGYSMDEVVGMHVWDMMEDGEQKESLGEYIRQLAREQPEPTPYVCRNIVKGGGVIDVEVNWNYRRDEMGRVSGFVCILSDITERKQVEEALRDSEERFRRAVTEAPFPIMIHADDGEVLQINEVWTELTGYEPEEIPTLSAWMERAYGERKDVVKSRIDKIFSYDTRVEEGEYVISSKDGGILTWDFSSAPLRRLPDGRRTVISIAMDVTDRKEAEEKIEKLAKFPSENPEPVLRVMRDGRILYGNRASLAIQNAWGCKMGEKLGGERLKVIVKALNLGKVMREDTTYEGHVFSVTLAPVAEADYVNVYGHDVTDLREAEEALYWESSVNKTLAELSNILNKPYYSFEEISDLVLAHAKRLTGSAVGCVGYIDERTGYLVCPTMTKAVWKQCQIPGKDIVFKEFNGMWGWVIKERRSVLTNSLADDAHAAGTPAGHIPITGFVGAPSMAGGEVVGMVAVANSERGYVARDLWLAERLAEIYALAVGARRAGQKIEGNQRQLQSLVSNLGLSEERRRRRIAKGIHEEMIRPLCLMENRIVSLVEGQESSSEVMPGVREAIGDLVDVTRSFVSELSFPMLGELGLAVAVERWLSEEVAKKHGVATVFENGDDFEIADEDLKYFLFEAIRDLLANVVEHARARRVKVSFAREADELEVIVADDGVGFDAGEAGWDVNDVVNYGLFSIRERLRYLGGDLVVESQPGEGTKAVLRAPLEVRGLK